MVPIASAAAPPAQARSGGDCITVIHGDYHGNSAHVDLYISNVVWDGDRLYINGEPYPKTVLNRIEKAYGYVSGNSSHALDPDHPQHPLHPGAMNPIFNPLKNAVLGPFEDFMEDFDSDELPTVHVGVKVPSPTDDPAGVRLTVIINLQVCSGQ